jgi:hypothetical protein
MELSGKDIQAIDQIGQATRGSRIESSSRNETILSSEVVGFFNNWT